MSHFLSQETTLSQKVLSGGFWVFTLRIFARFLELIRLVILARILAPHDFGLMGIALLTMATLDTFSQPGFQMALIQKKKDITSYLDSAWTVLVLRGFILFVILYLIAPYAAIFFKTPAAKLIMQVVGISILFQALTNIGVVYFRKDLEFKKEFLYHLSFTLVDFIVAVSAVLILRNVWALVLGLLAGNAARFFVSYAIHPYRPRLRFELGKAGELFGFGKWVLGTSILIFMITRGDDIFVAKLLGVAALGFYQMAYLISNAPATEIAHVISQVTLPAFSKMQDNISRLREAYLRVLQLSTFLSFPIAGLIVVLSSDFTKIFLGEKWMPMVPAMQILVFAGLLRSIAATTTPIFYAVGKPRIDTILEIIRLLVMVILIYPFTIKWGISGTSLVVLVSIFVANIGFSITAIRITKCKMNSFSKVILLPLINTTIMILSVFLLKANSGLSGMSGFFISISIGILIYLGITYLFNRFLDYKILYVIFGERK